MNPRVLIVAAAMASLACEVGSAQTAYPMLMSLKPVAAQVGQTTEHTIHARYSMYDAYQVFVTGAGVTGEIVHPEKKEADKDTPPNLEEMKVKFTVAPDALPGVRDFRIATPRGVSTLGQLVIARDAVVVESDKNDTADQALEINVPSTACGAIEKAEDVDHFKFKVEAGAALSFHVRSMRLQDKIHDLQNHSDPIMTLRNSSGVTLAASDNYFYGDPFFGYEFQHSGEYFLEIRDVRYQGNKYWEYSVEISDRPFVTNVYPLGLAAGGKAQVEMVGFRLPENRLAEIQLPMELPVGAAELPLPLASATTNPAPVIVSDLPLAAEAPAENNTFDQAQLVAIPAGINGRLEASADIDCFAFEAKKDERFTFEVVARRQQSSLDSHLRILDAQGKQLALNDDLRLDKRSFADSLVENWTVPADGKYVIEIRDLHLRGGSSFVYFIKVTRSEPSFDLYADTDKTQLAPGASGVVFVRIVRKNGFDGEVQLHVDNLPGGVTAQCGRILAGKGQDGCLVMTAAGDAPMSIANVTIRGTATIGVAPEQRQLNAVAGMYQETYQPGGGRGHWPVDLHTVSVGASNDILDVKLSSYEITLKPGESQQIDITIERGKGYDKNVTLDVIYKHLSSVFGDSLPEGVTVDGAKSKTLLAQGATQGHITLKAADTAPPVEKQQIAVMADVSLNFVMKATYASRPVLVTVAKKE